MYVCHSLNETNLDIVRGPFSCGKTKCGFIVKFEIAPYFVELLNSQLKDVEYFVALFDESFNCVAKKNNKKKQMDLHIRF